MAAPMSTNDFLMLWVPCSAALLACRMVPALALRGRALPPRVVEALGLIPPAAFAALVTNDLFDPARLAAGPWACAMPVVVAALVAVVARVTRSMLWCCVLGLAFYLLLSII